MKDDEHKPNTGKMQNNNCLGIEREKEIVGEKKFTREDFLAQTKRLNKGVYDGGIVPADINIMNKN